MLCMSKCIQFNTDQTKCISFSDIKISFFKLVLFSVLCSLVIFVHESTLIFLLLFLIQIFSLMQFLFIVSQIMTEIHSSQYLYDDNNFIPLNKQIFLMYLFVLLYLFLIGGSVHMRLYHHNESDIFSAQDIYLMVSMLIMLFIVGTCFLIVCYSNNKKGANVCDFVVRSVSEYLHNSLDNAYLIFNIILFSIYISLTIGFDIYTNTVWYKIVQICYVLINFLSAIILTFIQENNIKIAITYICASLLIIILSYISTFHQEQYSFYILNVYLMSIFIFTYVFKFIKNLICIKDDNELLHKYQPVEYGTTSNSSSPIVCEIYS